MGASEIWSRDFTSRKSNSTNAVNYPLEDNQGSGSTLTDASGTNLVRQSYNAFGLPRDGADWDGPEQSGDQSIIDGISRRGYTGHSMLGAMGLIHMNGRVQDAITGRFLSPDPHVQNPGFTQSFNRYAYVNNNPLTFVDPSGFYCDDNGRETDVPENENGDFQLCEVVVSGCSKDSLWVQFFCSSIYGMSTGDLYCLLYNHAGCGPFPVSAIDGSLDDAAFGRVTDTLKKLAAPPSSPPTPPPGGVVTTPAKPQTEIPCKAGTQCSVVPVCLRSASADLQNAYRDAKRTAFGRFNAFGGDKEEAYTIFRNNSTGDLVTDFTTGIDSYVRPYLGKTGHALQMSGHIHNRPVGISIQNWKPAIAFAGPSGADRAAKFDFPLVPFIHHERRDGAWHSECVPLP